MRLPKQRPKGMQQQRYPGCDQNKQSGMFYTVQICRALAALLVVVFHAAGNLAKARYFGEFARPLEIACWFGGEAGVAFFFVLSGFLIYHVHRADFNHPKRVPSYLRKRITRIYPTYIIIFLCTFTISQFVPAFREGMPTEASVLIKSILLLPQDSNVVGGTGAPVLIVAWSLQYEIFFYGVFCLALIRRWIFLVAIAIISLNILVGSFFIHDNFPQTFFRNHLVLLFGIGMLSGVAVRSSIYPAGNAWLVAGAAVAFGLVGILATQNRATYHRPYFDMGYGFASAFLIFGLVRLESRKRSAGILKRFNVLGDASYALYLLHFPLIAILSKIAILVLPINSFGANVAFFTLVLGSFLAAIVFHILIEEPLLRRLSATAQRTTTQPVVDHSS